MARSWNSPAVWLLTLLAGPLLFSALQQPDLAAVLCAPAVTRSQNSSSSDAIARRAAGRADNNNATARTRMQIGHVNEPAASQQSNAAADANEETKGARGDAKLTTTTTTSTTTTSPTTTSTTTTTTTTRRPPTGVNNPISTHYKLPTWFNWAAYKSLHGKHYASQWLDELHKRIYLRTGLRVLEQRAQFRAGRLNSLAAVNELSDLTSEQLASFQGSDGSPIEEQAEQEAGEWPACCSYDQVYERLIELLERAASAQDRELSRALLAELKQEPPLVNQIGADAGRPTRPPAHKLGEPTRARPIGTDRAELGRPLESTSSTTSARPRRLGNHNKAGADSGRKRAELAPTAAGGGGSRKSNLLSDANRVAGNSLGGGAESERPVGVPSLALPRELEDEVRRQVAEQLSPSSPLGRLLNKQLSEYFGQPVELRAKRPAAVVPQTRLAPGAIKKTI